MNDCLITKLQSSVEGDSLPRLGEFIVEFETITNPTDKDMYICVNYRETTPGAADYSGYVRLLTEGSMRSLRKVGDVVEDEDVGTRLDISDNRTKCLIVPNGGKIAIGNKYFLDTLGLYSDHAVETLRLGSGGRMAHKKFNVADITYCEKLRYLSLRNATMIGEPDFSLMTDLLQVALSLQPSTALKADMFMNNYKLTSCQFTDSGISGDFKPVFLAWAAALNKNGVKTYKKVHPFSIIRTQATIDGQSYGTSLKYVEIWPDSQTEYSVYTE